MSVMDYYLLFGILVHVALLVLVDWLGYTHFVNHGYHHSLLLLALLNVAIGLGLYYLVLRPLYQRLRRRRMAQAIMRQRAQQ